IERVRFHGEPVAVVVAETKREAAEAAELVDVSYEDLPAVIDADEALKPDAPVLHERRGERVGDEGMDEGEKGLVGNVCAIARVRVSAPYVGGGYGTKSYTKVEGMTAAAAFFTGRAVKLDISVEEAMLTTRSASAHIRARSAFTKDGMLLARDFQIVMNNGAYTDNTPLVNSKTANRCFGPYRIPALRVVARSVFTNTVPSSSLRGFGAPQGIIAGELQMDEAAAKLGIDPVELRLRNLVGPGEEFMPGKRPLDADLKDDLRCLASSLEW